MHSTVRHKCIFILYAKPADGVFWMSIEDLSENMDAFEICDAPQWDTGLLGTGVLKKGWLLSKSKTGRMCVARHQALAGRNEPAVPSAAVRLGGGSARRRCRLAEPPPGTSAGRHRCWQLRFRPSRHRCRASPPSHSDELQAFA